MIFRRVLTLFTVTVLFVGVVLFVPTKTSADHTSAHNIEQLQQQITALLQQITVLQAQLAAQGGGGGGTTNPVPPAYTCPVFSYNFYLGSRDVETDGQVTKLQEFLARDSAIYPEAQITGYFGPLTEQAVKRWQARHGVVSSGGPETTGYGVVGPKTRAAIREACGDDSSDSSTSVSNRDSRRTADIRQIQLALELYYDAEHTYPTSLSLLAPRMIASIPKDPLGSTYLYRALGDGCSGTAGNSCENYHLGASLENRNHSALTFDVDRDSSALFGGFNGLDSGACEAVDLDRHCYDQAAGNSLFPTPSSDNDNMGPTNISPSISVLSPDGGEVFTMGSRIAINWSMSNIASKQLNIYLLKGGAVTQFIKTKSITVDTALQVTTFWDIPKDFLLGAGSDYAVRVEDASNGSVYDHSYNTFSIVRPDASTPRITITSPNGGERFTEGTSIPVTWTSSGIAAEEIVIGFCKPNTDQCTEQASRPNTGSAIIPLRGALGIGVGDWVVEITDRSDTYNKHIFDRSDSAFTITSTASNTTSIKVLSPNGGETWAIGEQKVISWTPSDSTIGAYAIEIWNANGTQSWSILGYTGNKSYLWKVGKASCNDIVGSCSELGAGTYKIRIRGHKIGDPEGSYSIIGNSETVFTITGNPESITSIKVLQPNGGEIVKIGDPISVSWVAEPTINADVWLYFYKNVSGSSTSGIQSEYAELVSGGSPYQWNLPSFVTIDPNASYKVQVRGTGQYFSVSDISDAPFEILPVE